MYNYWRKQDFRFLHLGVRSLPSPHHSTSKEMTNSDNREILATVVPHKVEVMFIHLRNESILKNSAFLFESLSAHRAFVVMFDRTSRFSHLINWFRRLS
jgi:predicted GNAT superfamily acetyltransferase